VVRAEYAKANPKNVAAFIATYLRGWGWAKANPEEAAAALKRFYGEGGVEISDKAIKQEFALRPTFSLGEQLKLLDRSGGPSDADRWFGNIGAFMAEVGTLPRPLEAKAVVTDEYMKIVADDPKLKAFATEFDGKQQ
jgi:ABC-type nitrate/sulfonate/bicarbonate transport system substrate-binding protein